MKGVRCWFLLAVRACMLADTAFATFGNDSRMEKFQQQKSMPML